jgi:hypothetical protein
MLLLFEETGVSRIAVVNGCNLGSDRVGVNGSHRYCRTRSGCCLAGDESRKHESECNQYKSPDPQPMPLRPR